MTLPFNLGALERELIATKKQREEAEVAAKTAYEAEARAREAASEAAARAERETASLRAKGKQADDYYGSAMWNVCRPAALKAPPQ